MKSSILSGAVALGFVFVSSAALADDPNEPASAVSTAWPMLAPAASSSRSLNSGWSRAGTGPPAPSLPTNAAGVR